MPTMTSFFSPAFSWWCGLLLLSLISPAMAAPNAPYPEPGITVAALTTFFAALQAYANMTEPARTLRQCIAGVFNNLAVMDARIRTAWQNYSSATTALGNDPYAITEDEFRNLCVTAVRRPDELLLAINRFQRLRCIHAHQIHDFTCTFRASLDTFRNLGAAREDNLYLANEYLSKLPPDVVSAVVSRQFTTFEQAAALAAAHCTAPPPAGAATTATPMELSHLQFAEEYGIEPVAAQHLLAMARQQFERNTPTTPARPNFTPGRTRLSEEEKNRRSAAGLCNYCGLHPQGTHCAADALKKARRAAQNGQPRQGNA